MSGYLTASWLLDAEDEFRPAAHVSSIDGRAIAVVRWGSPSNLTIQSNDPAVLRRLATALAEAADKADAIIAHHKRVEPGDLTGGLDPATAGYAIAKAYRS